MDSQFGADRTPMSGLRPSIVLAGTVLPAFFVFLWHGSCYGTWLIDDAGISFAYAHNLASGAGWVSQPGRDPVEGFSNPLWTLLVALLYALRLFSISLTPKFVSCLLVAGSFVMFAAAIRRIMDQFEAVLVTGSSLLLAAANPGFVIWCVSGLENPLLTFLAAGLLFVSASVLQDGERLRKRACLIGGLLAAGLALTRPDALIYAIVFPLALAWNTARTTTRYFRGGLMVYGVYFAVPVLSYLIFRRIYFHDWLPNTYYAKPGVTLDGLFEVASLSGRGAAKAADLSSAICPVLPVLTPVLLLAAAVSTVLLPDRQVAGRIAVLGSFVALAFLTYIVLPQDWMGEYRFGTIAFPTSYLLGFYLLRQIVVRGPLTFSKRASLIGVGLAGLISSSPAFVQRENLFAAHPQTPLEDVATSALKYNAFADEIGLEHPTLLLPDLGGTLLLSRARAIDVAGLCDRDVAAIYHERQPPAMLAAYILDHVKPDLIHIHDYWSYRSGLPGNPKFRMEYADLGDGDYIRRASLPAEINAEDARMIKARLSDGSTRADAHFQLSQFKFGS